MSYPDISEIEIHFHETCLAWRFYFNGISLAQIPSGIYTGYKPTELLQAENFRKKEAEHLSCFALLANMEAALRSDYKIRVKNRKYRDGVSKAFRVLETSLRKKGKNPRLDDILSIWTKNIFDRDRQIFVSILAALDYRNWLAHGRYWELNTQHNAKYDFLSLMMIAGELKRYILSPAGQAICRS
ncbi:MAG: hypothetical protein LBV76_03610 [Deltaproteobacteria bacterium]|jgi:hypothetical protein|nr:hypothetical protein [Deltaproteobacteria bacterium]